MYSENNKMVELENRMNKLENAFYELKEAIKQKDPELGEITKTTSPSGDNLLSRIEHAKIEDIMRNFNFEKVHQVMKMLNWKWALTEYGTPTIDELKEEARRLLVESAVEETNVATGGFRAVYEKDGVDDPDPFISLEFIVEECEGFEENEEPEEDDDKE